MCFQCEEVLHLPVWSKIHFNHQPQATLEPSEWSEANFCANFSENSTVVASIVNVRVQPSVQKHHSAWECGRIKSFAFEGHNTNCQLPA